MHESRAASSTVILVAAFPVWDLRGHIFTSRAADLSSVMRSLDDLETLLVASSGDDWFVRHD